MNGNAAIARPIDIPKVLISTKLGARRLGSSEKNFRSHAYIQQTTNFTVKQL